MHLNCVVMVLNCEATLTVPSESVIAAHDSLVRMWEKKGIWINIPACFSFIKGKQ